MCHSMVEYLLSMQKALDSIPRTSAAPPKKKPLKFKMLIGREQKKKKILSRVVWIRDYEY